jgi:hypothetical protein
MQTTYIILVRALKIDDGIKELAEERKDSLVLIQWLETREEPKQQLELLPFASVQSLLCAVSYALHGLDCDFRLNLVAI